MLPHQAHNATHTLAPPLSFPYHSFLFPKGSGGSCLLDGKKMNGFNPGGESYVSPQHMLSFVGLESSSSSNTSSQKQQLWDWETTTPPPNATTYQAPFFANTFNNTSFYGSAAASPGPPVAMAGAGGSGAAAASYPFHPVQAGPTDYPMMKSEEYRERQVIGLNLGQRTYFPASGGGGGGIDQLFQRSRGVFCQVGQVQVPRCQAEGCKADLSGAKHYHRRHKVCELHSKATVVVAGGVQQRFCQQCSRFHLLSEFDEAKRSCRKRLAEHNRRRRKSQPSPMASATTSVRSAPPDTSAASTEKSKETSPKSTKNTAAEDIITTAATSISSISTLSQANIGVEKLDDNQKTAIHLRYGPALSLGGAEGADKGGFGFDSQYHHQQMPWAVMSEENNSSQQQQLQQPQQQRISSSSSSSSIFFQSQNFCSSATEASQSTTAGDHQNNLLQLGQGLLEVDFI